MKEQTINFYSLWSLNYCFVGNSVWFISISFSTKMYHIINLSSTLFTFYVIAILGGLIPQTMNSVISNGFIFIVVYFLNVKRHERLTEQLAIEINERLSEFK